MNRISILCAVDFTHASDEALEAAVCEARRRDAMLDLVHVWNPADPLSADIGGIGLPITHPESPVLLEQQLDSIPIDLPAERVRRHLVAGSAAEQIVVKAEELGSELLVVGTHARGVIGRWLIGSVASELLHTAPCPILVCRQPHETAKHDDTQQQPNRSEHTASRTGQ